MYGRGKENGTTSVKLANIKTQSNRLDCGLYAIANATTIASGEDPRTNSTRTKKYGNTSYNASEHKF